MNHSSIQEDLLELRNQLEPLVESFELDRPERGILGVVPVVGGVFRHPLSQEPVTRIKVYGAGKDRVKIVEPRFLRSLPPVSIAGISHPAEFCASVAKVLGEVLAKMGSIRNQAKAMDIALDLESNMIRLRGRAKLNGVDVELAAWQSGSLVVTALGHRELSGSVPRGQRTLILKGQAIADRDELLKLVDRLQRESAGPGLAPPPDSSSDAAEVLELTEAVEEVGIQPVSQESLGMLKVRKLLDKLGSETEVSAQGGRLQLLVPIKVVQGLYNFHLEQSGPTQFSGFLVTPKGARHGVEFDLQEIEDIKEVLDRVLLGK